MIAPRPTLFADVWRKAHLRAGHALAALLVLAAPIPTAHAQPTAPSDVTLVGQFFDDTGSHALLYVLMTKPKGKLPKGAVVGVKFENTDENYRFNGTYNYLDAYFLSADDWRKFAAIWQEARAAHGETEGGNYFDGQTEVIVGAASDGRISFSMAGNGHDEHDIPRNMDVFFLSAKDVAAFDRGVRQVSANFAK